MKSYIRASKASGSDKRKVERLIRRGWRPGLTYGAILARTPKHRPSQAGQEVNCER